MRGRCPSFPQTPLLPLPPTARGLPFRRCCASRCAGWNAPIAPSGQAGRPRRSACRRSTRLLPDGGLLTGALHEIEAGPSPSGRVAPHDGAALGFTAFLLGRLGPGTLLWCRQASGADAPPLRAGARGLVRSGAAADGHGAARRGSVLGDGGRPAHARHRRRGGRDARGRSDRRPPPVARGREERRAGAAAAAAARAAAKRLRHALAGGLGALARGLTQSRWQVELRRNRFGMPSAEETPSWLLEWNDETRRLAVVSQAHHGSAGAPQRQRLVG